MWHLHLLSFCLILPLLPACARDIVRDTSATDQPSVKDLFPINNRPLKSWSMAPQVSGSFAMTPEVFNLRGGPGPAATVVQGPDGRPALQATYAKGKFGPGSGFSFYALGPEQVNLTTAKEVTMSYTVFFEQGFEFEVGGMLPGLYGGDTWDLALACSDTDTASDKRDSCFQVSPMWIAGALGAISAHLPFSGKATNDEAICHSTGTLRPYGNDCPEEGDPRPYTVGFNAFQLAAGARTTLAQRVRLNDAGQANGEIELYVNGTSRFVADGLVIRAREESRIRGLEMRSYFGRAGLLTDKIKSPSPKDQRAYFGDFSIAITVDL